MLKVGSDFSGVGALNQALIRLGIDYDEVFACDMDKYARQTFIHNYGEPKYYPTDVYEREIPIEPLDLYVSSPPCQAFSLAGKRKGEEDKRGILFYNSHEFIMKNNPRYFIFENVKGLLSDSDGSTFNRWIEYLGGKSVNGMATMFPYDHSAPYHIYWEVLNAKDYNVPQNRERVFIVGIRDDADNDFRFPKPERLTKRLKDVLESEVDEKYYLSEKMVEGFKGIDTNGAARTIRCGGGSSKDDKHNWDLIKVGYINQDTQASQVYNSYGLGQNLCAGTHGYANGNIAIGAIRGINIDSSKTTQQQLEINGNGTSNALTTVQKDNIVVEYEGIGVHPFSKKMEFDGFKDRPCPTLLATDYKAPKCIQYTDYRIRKLTPRECFRLMDFPDTFTWPVSDSQAYKQAGNSVVVKMYELLIKKLLTKNTPTEL